MNWDVFAESYKDFLDRTNSFEKKSVILAIKIFGKQIDCKENCSGILSCRQFYSLLLPLYGGFASDINSLETMQGFELTANVWKVVSKKEEILWERI